MDKFNKEDTNIDEYGNITLRDHLLIRDKESGEIIFNKREIKGGKKCLIK